jgi:MtaA/CmuA family methyltransferase
MSKYSDLHNFLKNKDESSKRILFHPILMQFAAKLNHNTYEEFMTDFHVLVESNIKCLEKIDHDAVGLISDPYRETSAFGASVRFSGNNNPVCEPIVTNINDLDLLKNPDVYKSERTSDRIKAAEYYKKLIGDEVPIIGWIEGPLAEAADLAGVNNILFDILMEPDFVRRLMDICIVTAKDFARAQIEAGCMVIGIGDALCSQIDPETYCSYVLPLHQEIIDFIHELGAFTKLHICGDITHHVPNLALTRTDILDLDWMVDFAIARKNCKNELILCGNLDPVSCIQNLTPGKISLLASKLTEDQKHTRFILSGGCEITRDSPLENILAMKSFQKF